MSPDFSELLLAFNGHRVEYLLVVRMRGCLWSRARYQDIDVWVRPDSEMLGEYLLALSAFGAPLGDLGKDDLSKAGTIFQIGVPPLRIDVNHRHRWRRFRRCLPDRFKTALWGPRPL